MSFPHLFSPLQLGPVQTKNRVVLPPHGHLVSSLWGTEEQAARHIAYWAARRSAGWVDGVSAHVRNIVPPGFEPTGVGAQVPGHFRQPWFVDRVGRLAETLHAEETILTVQMILQGGMPHGASPRPSGPTTNLVPHGLSLAEIDYFVAEYGHGAEQIRATGADGVELHLNHDDMLEYFVSPLTNRRTDEYGGSLENRLRFPLRILAAVRAAIGPDRVLGVRLNLREEEPGGYDVTGAVEIARHLEASGLLDYLSCAIGSPWGNPSYIQSHHHRPGEWSDLAGRVRSAVSLPVVYTGRVTSPEVAERILADGDADLVGMARAIVADPEFLVKARAGRSAEIRPCIGGNDCISRRITESLTFSCAVNPAAGRELDGPIPQAETPERILVIGGGPAGMEVAAIAAERGHQVTLWEAADRLGGQLETATRAPRHEDHTAYLEWQRRRLGTAGVLVETGRRADADSVIAAGADQVLVATGGVPRRPEVIGGDLPFVHLGADVLEEVPDLGEHVVVIAEDDHIAPLSLADFLAQRGHRVTLVHGTAAPAPLLSRYLLGSILGRLDAGGVVLRGSEQVAEITPDTTWTRNLYSHRRHAITDVDSVVLSCSAVPEDDLHAALVARGVPARLLGDAFAPRRLVNATRQAYDLAITL